MKNMEGMTLIKISGKRFFCLLCCYLLVGFEGPVLLDGRVTKVFHLLQHCHHEGGPQLPCICTHPLSLLISDVLSSPRVIVEGR